MNSLLSEYLEKNKLRLKQQEIDLAKKLIQIVPATEKRNRRSS